MRKVKLGVLILSLIVLFMLSGSCLVLFARQDMNKKIITTNFAIYDVCRELMGDDDDILLLGEGVDMHSFQPTAHDIVNIANGELFIHIGGESDSWVSDIIETSNNDDMVVVSLIDKVETICSEDHHEHHDHEEHEHEFDEHIWLSLGNMQIITQVISSSLIECYPEKRHTVLNNEKAFINQLEVLDATYADTFSKETNVIIADRFPFTYLFSAYGINHYSLFTGCSAETEASPETIASFINKVNNLDVDYIYTLETSNSNNAKKIIDNSECKEGVEILTLNSMQAINKDKIEKESYIKIMYDNLHKLEKVIK